MDDFASWRIIHYYSVHVIGILKWDFEASEMEIKCSFAISSHHQHGLAEFSAEIFKALLSQMQYSQIWFVWTEFSDDITMDISNELPYMLLKIISRLEVGFLFLKHDFAFIVRY